MLDISNSLGKLPPQALDLEEAVIGAILLEKHSLKSVIEYLRPEHFYSTAHVEIYQACLDLNEKNKPIDMRTIVAELRSNGKIELVGGAYYIAQLTSKVSSAANIEAHAHNILEMYMRRTLITETSETYSKAYDLTEDIFELITKSENGINKISRPYNTRNIQDAKTALLNTIKQMQETKSSNGIIGVPSGFIELDNLTSGWQKATLVILAARPGMGKTACVVCMMLNASIKFKTPIAFFSLEMSVVQLTHRIISIESQIDLQRVIKNDLTPAEWSRIMAVTARFAQAPLFIDDTSGLSVFDIRARSRRLKEEHNIQMIVVDYLQLVTGEKGGNREQEISSISRGLKQISKDLDLPVIALSQLSRSVEQRGGDKRPMLSDLRESGSIEQDADIVLFLYRPAYYGIKEDEQGRDIQDALEVIAAKNRQGSPDNCLLKFIGKYTKVTDYNFNEPPPVSENEVWTQIPRKPYKEDEQPPF